MLKWEATRARAPLLLKSNRICFIMERVNKHEGPLLWHHDSPVHISYVTLFPCKNSPMQVKYNSCEGLLNHLEDRNGQASTERLIENKPTFIKAKQLKKGRSPSSTLDLSAVINNSSGWKATLTQTCGGLILKKGQLWCPPLMYWSPHPLMHRVWSCLPGSTTSDHP